MGVACDVVVELVLCFVAHLFGGETVLLLDKVVFLLDALGGLLKVAVDAVDRRDILAPYYRTALYFSPADKEVLAVGGVGIALGAVNCLSVGILQEGIDMGKLKQLTVACV